MAVGLVPYMPLLGISGVAVMRTVAVVLIHADLSPQERTEAVLPAFNLALSPPLR